MQRGVVLTMSIVYFSNYSGNTKRFVERLHGNFTTTRIPISWDELRPVTVSAPFVLFVPTYGGGSEGSAVPRQVVKFLNIKQNRDNIIGIVGFGNTNFGEHFCKAADIISAKTGAPVIARVEIFGTEEDVTRITERMESLNDYQV